MSIQNQIDAINTRISEVVNPNELTTANLLPVSSKVLIVDPAGPDGEIKKIDNVNLLNATFLTYFSSRGEAATIPVSPKVLIQNASDQPQKIDPKKLLDVAFTTITDLGDVSGTVNIDWSLAVKFKLNLTGNTTLTFSNFTAYEETKIQALEVTANASNRILAFPAGVVLADISDTPVNFALTTTRNYLSFRNLDSSEPFFQTANYVKII